MRYRLGVLLAGLLFIGVGANAFAQEPEVIEVGYTVNGQLGDQAETFVFAAEEGQQLIITLNSNAFDPLLIVNDANGRLVAEDDDGGNGLNARLTLVVPETGEYEIIVTSFRDNARGPFRLSVTLITLPTIAIGETVEGEFVGQTESYELTLAAQEPVVIELESDDFDVFLSVLDSEGVELITDDDSGEAFDALLVFVPTEAGVYVVNVDSSLPGRGNFELSVREGEMGEMTTEDDGATVEVANADLDAEEATYRFEAEAGEQYAVWLSSTAFDPLVIIRDADETPIALDDDGGSDLNALLKFTATETGEYTLVVTSFEGEGRGEYTLGLFQVDFPRDVEYTLVDTVAIGDLIEGEADGEQLGYTLVLEAGETVTIQLNSNEFDPRVVVFNATEQEVGADDDGGDGLNARLVFTAPLAGSYVVVVDSFDEAPEGTFTLRVSARN